MPLLLLGLLGAAGYSIYEKKTKGAWPWETAHTVTTPSWLPNIPPISKTYADYQNHLIDTNVVAWNLNTNQPITINSGTVISVSKQENDDLHIPGSVFWMNVNGVANRIYSALQ